MGAAITLWVCTLVDGRPERLSPTSPPVVALRKTLGSAATAVTEGPARWLRLDLTTDEGRATPAATRRWVEKRATGWTVLEVEPRHTLFLLPMSEPVELGAAELRDELEGWTENEDDIEVTITDHPTIPHMLRVDVLGRLSEETYHLWDQEAHVWPVDPELLRAERGQAEPAPCPACAGKGCDACGDMGIIPAPLGGYAGEEFYP